MEAQTLKWGRSGERYELCTPLVMVQIIPEGFAGLWGSKRRFEMYFDGKLLGSKHTLRDAKAHLEGVFAAFVQHGEKTATQKLVERISKA